jgi:hypothetical protein
MLSEPTDFNKELQVLIFLQRQKVIIVIKLHNILFAIRKLRTLKSRLK